MFCVFKSGFICPIDKISIDKGVCRKEIPIYAPLYLLFGFLSLRNITRCFNSYFLYVNFIAAMLIWCNSNILIIDKDICSRYVRLNTDITICCTPSTKQCAATAQKKCTCEH